MYTVTTSPAAVSCDTNTEVRSVDIPKGRCCVLMYTYTHLIIVVVSPDEEKDSDSGDCSLVHHITDHSSKATCSQSSVHSWSVAATSKRPTKVRVATQPKSTKRRKAAGKEEFFLCMQLPTMFGRDKNYYGCVVKMTLHS